eukprot:g19213.t1
MAGENKHSNLLRALDSLNAKTGAKDIGDQVPTEANFRNFGLKANSTTSLAATCGQSINSRDEVHGVFVGSLMMGNSTASPTTEIIKYDLEEAGPDKTADQTWYGYARIDVGATHAPRPEGEDRKAHMRVVRELDEVRIRHQVLTPFWSSSENLANAEVRRGGRNRVNLVTFFVFKQPTPGAKQIDDWSGYKWPIKSVRTVNKHALLPLQRAVETPTALAKRRLITQDKGRQIPLLFRGRSREFRVPMELEKVFHAGEAGLSKRAQAAVQNAPGYDAFVETVLQHIARTKNGCAVLTGDGRTAAVAIGEIIGDRLALRGDRRALHYGLRNVLAANGERPTSCGGVRKFGFGLVSPAQDFLDGHSRTVINDPRKSMSRRQQNLYNYLHAAAKRMSHRMTRDLLAKMVKQEFRSASEADMEVAVGAVMRTALTHYRYQSWPIPKISGTWFNVDVTAVSQLDTTFLSKLLMVTPGAIAQMIRKVTGDTFARYIGEKYRSASMAEALGNRTLEDEDWTIGKNVEEWDRKRSGRKPKPKQKMKKKETLLPPDDDDGADDEEVIAPDDPRDRGQPNTQSILRFITDHILHVGRILIMDPGRENVSYEIVSMLLGFGVHVRIVTTNTPRALADNENAHLHLKADLAAIERSPLLRELPLSSSLELCVAARRNRRGQYAFLSTGEEYQLRGQMFAPETGALCHWDVEKAKKSREVRAEHREAAIAAASDSYLSTKLRTGLREVKEIIRAKEKGSKVEVGDLIETKDKSGHWGPAHFKARDQKNKQWVVNKPGKPREDLGVSRGDVRHVPDSEALIGIPDTIEVFESDLPYLDVIHTSRVKREGERAVQGKSKLVPCVDCGELRYLPDTFRGDAIRCVNLRPHVYCGDFSDDQLVMQGMWVPERKPVERKISTGWDKNDAATGLPPTRSDSKKQAVTFGDEDELHEFPVGEGANGIEPDLAGGDGGNNEEELAPVPSAGEQDAEASSDSESELSVSAQSDSNEDDLLGGTDVEVRDLEIGAFDAFCDLLAVQSYEAKVVKEKAAETGRESGKPDLRKTVSWVPDDAALGLACEQGSAGLKAVIDRLAENRVPGPNAETPEFATLANLLSDAPTPGTHWTAARWLLEDISTVWGLTAAEGQAEQPPVRHERVGRKFMVVVPEGDKGTEYRFTREGKGRKVIGAVRFEFAAYFLAVQGDPKERVISVHTPGMTAAARKRLRSAKKLADLLPKNAVDTLALDRWLVYALLKELTGTLVPQNGEVLPNVLPAVGKLAVAEGLAKELLSQPIGDRDVITSRYIIDGKFWSDYAMVVKIRWAPGGHLQPQPDESGENSSPTLASSEFRLMCCLTGKWKKVFGIIFDVPRAFNISQPYDAGQEPVMRFPAGMSPRFETAFEEALGLLNQKHGATFARSDLLLIRVPQYGLLDAAYAFYKKARTECIRQSAMPSLLSPTVYRLVKDGEVMAMLGSHVDAFFVLGNDGVDGMKAFLKRRMLAAFSSLREEHFQEIGPEWVPIAGKSVRMVTEGGHQALDVSFHEKVQELVPWESDAERQGAKGDPMKRLSPGEVTRLPGADELRSVQNARRINSLVSDLKKFGSKGEVYVRSWLNFSKPVFLLMSDGSFQSRPVKVAKAGEKKTGSGMAELIGEEEIEKLTLARAEQLRPITAHSLIFTDKHVLEDAARKQEKLRCNLLDWGVKIFETAAKGSYGSEAVAVGYDFAGQQTEITKLKFTEFTSLLPAGVIDKATIVRAEELEQCDFLDSSSSGARAGPLSTCPTPGTACVDIGAKRWPAGNPKRERVRELMRGWWEWRGGPGDKRGDPIGVLRKLEKRDPEWFDYHPENSTPAAGPSSPKRKGTVGDEAAEDPKRARTAKADGTTENEL